ncbi:MAG: hypothetical protein NUW37_01300 [Planctomycetes bacterium]|nr:hypothetical protein [Planctomycetota bacterium]
MNLNVIGKLEEHGLLLCHDGKFVCATSIIAGEQIAGTWWGHPKGNLIYNVLEEVLDSPDVIAPKLIAGKVTLIHRKLWPAFFTIVRETRPWQKKALKDDSKALLKIVAEEGRVRSDEIVWTHSRKLGDATRDLERKLLVYCKELHSDSGAHFKEILTWETWKDERNVHPEQMDYSLAISEIESAAKSLYPKAKLPWS